MEIIGSTIEICLAQFIKLCETSGPILLIGQSGSGKDHLVKYAHQHILGKPENSFQTQNCSRPLQTLLEELYGYANLEDYDSVWEDNDTIIPGSIDLASQGTLYLDHIHLIPPDGEQLITNILAGHPFYPKGSVNLRDQDNVRIVASCIPHPIDGALGFLPKSIHSYFHNRFIVLPSLSQRKDEIPDILAYFYANTYQSSIGKIPEIEIEQELIDNAERIPDNLKGLKAIARRFSEKNPHGGKISWALASEYIERRVSQQSVDSQRHYRCKQMSFNLRYQGELVDGDKLYSWIRQFARFHDHIACDPIDISETLLKHICERYFYTDAKIISLLTNMHDRLMKDMEQYIAKTRSSAERSRYTPAGMEEKNKNDTQTVLSQLIVTAPLGPMKSSDAINLKYRKIASLVPTKNACEFEKLGQWYSNQTSLSSIVILDDFIGSGSQFEKIVRKVINNQNLMVAHKNHRNKPNLKIYVLICVAFEEGVQRALRCIENAPDWLIFELICGQILDNKDRVFRPESSIFPNPDVRKDAEKIIVELLGKNIYPIAPRGYEDIESIVVFEHNIPNDSLPVLYQNRDQEPYKWHAIFPRMKTS